MSSRNDGNGRTDIKNRSSTLLGAAAKLCVGAVCRACDARAGIYIHAHDVFKRDIADVNGPAIFRVGAGRTVGQRNGDWETVEAARCRARDIAPVELIL